MISFENLKNRVDRFFRSVDRHAVPQRAEFESPNRSLAEFLNFTVDALPDGEVYLFGGVLRDLALLGRKGFNSDIDIVVEGDWASWAAYLESRGAQKNKFGGYRLDVAGWPVDLWHAQDTWAIRQGHVSYQGIVSLTETTVLNWDAVLMNWRTRTFIHREGYLEDLRRLELDIVLECNPNPLGMAVRVFRHLCAKDAAKVSPAAVEYLGNCSRLYSYEDIRDYEMRSYGSSLVLPAVHRFFKYFNIADPERDVSARYSIARDILERELNLVLGND